MYTWLHCGTVQGFGTTENLYCIEAVVGKNAIICEH